MLANVDAEVMRVVGGLRAAILDEIVETGAAGGMKLV